MLPENSAMENIVFTVSNEMDSSITLCSVIVQVTVFVKKLLLVTYSNFHVDDQSKNYLVTPGLQPFTMGGILSEKTKVL